MSDEKKKLMRSNDNKWLAGVCGGLGDYFSLDATIFRVLFVLFSLFIGGGLIVYIILWIIMPSPQANIGGIDISDEKFPPDVG